MTMIEDEIRTALARVDHHVLMTVERIEEAHRKIDRIYAKAGVPDPCGGAEARLLAAAQSLRDMVEQSHPRPRQGGS